MMPIIPGIGKGMPGERFFNSYYPILIALAFGIIFTIRHYFKGAQCTNVKSMKDKVVIITGANSGIGLELTKLLCLAGAKVIMGCRTLKKFEDAKNEVLLEIPTADVKFLQLDLSSFKSIKNFANEFLKSENKLDILINNAGVLSSEADKLTEDGFNWVIQVNYLGHFLLTQLLLNILKKTPNSRIVNNTAHAYTLADENFEYFLKLTHREMNGGQSPDISLDVTNESYMPMDDYCYDCVEEIKWQRVLEHVFRNFNQLENKDLMRGSAYSVSKLAMLLFTKELASIIGQNDPSVNAANPGVVNSSLYNDLTFKKSPIMNIMIGPIFWFFIKPPRNGAQTALHCATNSDWLGDDNSGGNNNGGDDSNSGGSDNDGGDDNSGGENTGVGGDGNSGVRRPTGKLYQECVERDITLKCGREISDALYNVSLRICGLKPNPRTHDGCASELIDEFSFEETSE